MPPTSSWKTSWAWRERRVWPRVCFVSFGVGGEGRENLFTHDGGLDAGALVDRLDDVRDVAGIDQRLAHAAVVERLLLVIEGEIAHIGARALQQGQRRIVAHALEIARRRIARDVALAGLQLGVA